MYVCYLELYHSIFHKLVSHFHSPCIQYVLTCMQKLYRHLHFGIIHVDMRKKAVSQTLKPREMMKVQQQIRNA